MNIQEKKDSIFSNISLLNNHNNIINFLKLKETEFTKNINGIFVNLNTLSDIIVEELFTIVNSEIETQINKSYEIDTDELNKIFYVNRENIIKKEKDKIKNNHNETLIEDIKKSLTKKELDIIKYSKIKHI